MEEKNIASKVVQTMMDSDWFSQWLGINVIEVAPGSAKLEMSIRKEMLNGFAIAHGGITYSLADSALAFASNGHGRKSVSVETSISHLVALKEGDKITAIATEESCSNKIGVYSIVVINDECHKVALFKGTVYRTSSLWFQDK